MDKNIEKIKMIEMESKIDSILQTLNELKENTVKKKYYTTKEVSEATGIGKTVIDKLRQNGEISYSKVGKTYIFTQDDLDQLIMNNKVKYA